MYLFPDAGETHAHAHARVSKGVTQIVNAALTYQPPRNDKVSAPLTPTPLRYIRVKSKEKPTPEPSPSQLHLDAVYIHTHVSLFPPYSSFSLGCTITTTTRLATVNANAKNDTKSMTPRLAGNLPSMTHRWLSVKRRYPRNRMTMLMPRNVAPRGFPSWRRVCDCVSPEREVFRRKSCVTAMPIDAKAREVRNQARKVRSVTM